MEAFKIKGSLWGSTCILKLPLYLKNDPKILPLLGCMLLLHISGLDESSWSNCTAESAVPLQPQNNQMNWIWSYPTFTCYWIPPKCNCKLSTPLTGICIELDFMSPIFLFWVRYLELRIWNIWNIKIFVLCPPLLDVARFFEKRGWCLQNGGSQPNWHKSWKTFRETATIFISYLKLSYLNRLVCASVPFIFGWSRFLPHLTQSSI